MFKDAKVGDRVFSIRLGWGTIGSMEPNCPSDFICQYVPDSGNCGFWFTVSGGETKGDLFPSVFWGEPKFEMPQRPPPELEVDTPVLVRDKGKPNWVSAHFAEWEGHRIRTWLSGRTSHTEQVKRSWDEWKLPEED